MRPSDVSPSHVCLHQETGLSPQARTFSRLGLFVGVYQVLAHHSFYIGLHIRKTSIKDDDRLHCDMMSSVRRRAPVTASHRRTYSSLTIFLRLKLFDLFLFKHGTVTREVMQWTKKCLSQAVVKVEPHCCEKRRALNCQL